MFFDDEKLKMLEDSIQIYFDCSYGHDFDHTKRVYNMALNIAENYNVDIDVIKASALLHDIARIKEDNDNTICHAEEGAKMAKTILENINFPQEKISAVCDCILKHRFSKKVIPQTIEEKIIQDSDRLDSIGAIVITRAFQHDGKRGIKAYNDFDNNDETTIKFFYERTLKLKPSTFHLEESRKIAAKRYRYTKCFINRFIKEWNGEL